MVTLQDNNGTPVVSNLKRIASGLRNAASLAIDPSSGDLYIADNGIDGNDDGNEAWSTDELDRIPAAQIGVSRSVFRLPGTVNGQLTESYVKTIDQPGDPVTVVNPGVGVQPLIAFEPLPDSVLTAEGSESEGSSGFALSPPSSRPGSIMVSSSASMASLTREGRRMTRTRSSSLTRAPAITLTSSRTI